MDTEKENQECPHPMQQKPLLHDSASFYTGSGGPEVPLGIASEAPVCASGRVPCALRPAARLGWPLAWERAPTKPDSGGKGLRKQLR